MSRHSSPSQGIGTYLWTCALLFLSGCGEQTRARPDADLMLPDNSCQDMLAINYQQPGINGDQCLFGGVIAELLGARFERAFDDDDLFQIALSYGASDTDDDGCLTSFEYATTPAPHVEPDDAFAVIDADADACVSADEWFVFRVITDEAAELFASTWDTSGDSLLQRSEHHALLPFDTRTLDFLYEQFPGAVEEAVTSSSFLLIYAPWARQRYPEPSPAWAND